MNITIHRDGQQYGPYTLEQVQEYIVGGTLNQETDLAWCEGMTDWIPLKDVILRLTSFKSSVTPPPSFGTPNVSIPQPQKTITKSKYDVPLAILSGIGLIVLYVCSQLFSCSDNSNTPNGNNVPTTSDQQQIQNGTLSAEINVTPSSDPLAGVKYLPENVDAIRDQVFVLSKGHPEISQIKFLVHLQAKDKYGKDIQIDVPIVFGDLTEVRKFTDPNFYKQSDVDDAHVITDAFDTVLSQFNQKQYSQ